jgi:hypothetical protein
MKLIEKTYCLVRKNILKRYPDELQLNYKSIDVGHNGFEPDLNIVKNVILKMDKDKFLFLEIITGFNKGTTIRDRLIKFVDTLYLENTIDYYFCPGDIKLTSDDLKKEHEWFNQLLPIEIKGNKGCLCVFFFSSSILKEKYPLLLNSHTIYIL